MIEANEITIPVPAHHVWRVFADVERWPEWTASITRLTFAEGDEIAVGSAVRIKQPRFPELTWRVTDVDPGASWTWVTTSPGATTSAVHVLERVDATTTRVTQRIEQRGPIGGLVGRLARGTTRRYLAMEAEGLRRRCEATWDAGATSA
ncbi:MAG TPA: SRPBCC family protein [Acidimicrobiales bacterium]|nr:SRPBCC family protein [Acidimicrobiales bacterium]